ncbi:PAS domain-containing protein [Azospirillum thermophilum]|uniref:histidine kinase n=1 Tax=Azospirillum thermophilum TaxID=2202148 RepID=A0A2S2D0P8_9PROT|nr:PAS domain-containing protein [Azospirillum thermophilum]AWK90220.1 hypothetical protein DEW08_29855 [Azospirillum thermophilum]
MKTKKPAVDAGGEAGLFRLMGPALVMLMLVTALIGAVYFTEKRAEADAVMAVADRGEAVLSVMKDAETGERGFVITGREEFLEPYQAALSQIGGQLDELDAMAGDQAELITASRHIRDLVGRKLAYTQRIIDDRRATGTIQSPEIFIGGKAAMDELRGEIAGLQAYAQRMAEDRRAEMQAVAAAALVLTGLFGISALVMLRQTRRLRLQQRTLEGRIRTEQERWRTLLEATPNLVWTAAVDGRIDYVSPQFAAFTGLEPPHILGAADAWASIVHPDDRARVVRGWEAAVAGGRPYEIDQRTRRHDGAWLWQRVRAQPLHDEAGRLAGWIGSNTDIHDRITAEQALRQREALLRAVLQSTEELIYAKDLDGRYIVVSQAVSRLIGRPPEACIGLTDRELFPAERADRYIANDREVVAGNVIRRFEEFFAVAGAERIYQSTKAPLTDSRGMVIGVVGVSTDVTERRQAEQATERARAAAEAASRAKTRFLASASHDLRQPVQSLTLFIDLLADRLRDRPDEYRLVKPMQQSLDALSGLLTSLLDVGRLEAGQVRPNLEDAEIAPLLERLCGEYVRRAEAKGIRLRTVPCRRIGRTDPVLFERILRNLLENALRYTESGSVLVGCRAGRGRLRIEVLDTGPGIPEDRQQEIFEEFVQIGNPERDRDRGLGLGLSIVKRTAELLGHRLGVASVPGRGSRFWIEMPAAAVPQPARAAAAPVQGRLSGRVLAVDDEALLLISYTTMLEEWGCEVVPAGGVEEAMEALRQADRPIDAVLTDFRLRAGERGTDVIHKVRELYGARVPAALLTGDTAPDRLREAASGDYLLLHKPIGADALRRAVAGLLAQSRPLHGTG